MTRHTTFAIAIVISGLIFISPSIAQEQKRDQTVLKFDGGGLHQGESDLGDGGDAFALDRWFFSLGVDYGWSQRDSIASP